MKCRFRRAEAEDAGSIVRHSFLLKAVSSVALCKHGEPCKQAAFERRVALPDRTDETETQRALELHVIGRRGGVGAIGGPSPGDRVLDPVQKLDAGDPGVQLKELYDGFLREITFKVSQPLHVSEDLSHQDFPQSAALVQGWSKVCDATAVKPGVVLEAGLLSIANGEDDCRVEKGYVVEDQRQVYPWLIRAIPPLP
jgi:hypothetical protein